MPQQTSTIVVGVSASSKSPTALAWAAEQARLTGARVVAVRAWRAPNPQATPSGTPAGLIQTPATAQAEAQARLEQDVQDVLGEDHGLEVRLVAGGKKKVLVETARDADLLVVDAPRRLTAGPMFAHRLVYAASCPVVVMPPRISGQGPSPLARAGRAVGRQALKAAGTAGHPGSAYRRPGH